MDSAAFATWRVGIELLNSAQRSLAFQDLALAEANDAVEYRDDDIDETAQEDRAEAVREGEGEATPEIVAPAAVGPIRRRTCFRRSATAELSTLVALIVAGMKSVVGAGRTAGLGIAARSAGRHSARWRERRLLHYKDRWIDQAQALTSRESVVKAAERCAINRTIAFRWRHRFLSALNLDKPTSLSGIVEADETFVLNLSRASAKTFPDRRASGRQSQQTRPVGGTNLYHRRP